VCGAWLSRGGGDWLCWLLKALGPTAGVVVHAQDFEHVVPNPIGDNKWRFWNDQLTRSGNTARMTQLRIFGQEVLDTIEDLEREAFGSGGIIRGNMSA
jgi:hypothetical protein